MLVLIFMILTIGYLFTIGITGFTKEKINVDWFVKLIMLWLIWPVELGDYLHERF